MRKWDEYDETDDERLAHAEPGIADLDFNKLGDGGVPDRSHERPACPVHLIIILAHVAALFGAAVFASVLKELAK